LNPEGDFRFFYTPIINSDRGWLHLLNNILALFIFSDNVENRMGHFGYLAFYIACGLLAAVTQIIVSPEMSGPMTGASGANCGFLRLIWSSFCARTLTLFLLIVLP
jgi:rhomboid family protein